jgi:hypothetical protein
VTAIKAVFSGNVETYNRDSGRLIASRFVYPKLVVLPCVNEVTKGLAGLGTENWPVRERRDKKFVTQKTCTNRGKRGSDQTAATLNMCTYDGKLQYAGFEQFPAKDTCDSLVTEDFIQSIALTALALLEDSPNSAVVLTSHTNRMNQMFGTKVANGAVIKIQITNELDAKMTQIFSGRSPLPTATASSMNQQTFKLTRTLPDLVIYMVRHGEGVHNQVKNDWEQKHDNGLISKTRLQWKKQFKPSVADASLTQQGIVDAFVGGHCIAEDLDKNVKDVIFCASDLLRAQQTSLCIYHHLSRIGRVIMTEDLEQMFSTLVLAMTCKRSDKFLCADGLMVQ